MLPKAFQEELVFWYYDTYEHAKEDKDQAESAQRSLTQYLEKKKENQKR